MSINKGPQVRAFRADNRYKHLNIFIEEIQGQEYYIANPATMVRRHEKDMFLPVTPTTTLSPTAAQQLIDDLWDCGLRPSEGSGSAGQLAAVERHLKDMQTLVFEK